MKKGILLIIFFAAISSNFNAQITINQSDMPTAGDVQATIVSSVTTGISIGSPGANQTWDFSILEGIDTTFSEFVSPAGTPGESAFPTATLASVSGGDYFYLEINSSAVLSLGATSDTSGMGDYFDLPFDPTEQLFELPTTYGTNYLDESRFSITADGESVGFDSIRLTTRMFKDVNFDAWGTVIIPGGSFDCLREEDITTSYDTLEVYAFGFWTTLQTDITTDTSYHWYSKESKGILVNIEIADGEVFYAEYQDLTPTISTPVASFTYNLLGQGEVDFTDQSSNQPTSWEWDFGDTNSSTMQNPSHTFATSGIYEVCLTATNSAGSNTICQPLDIQIGDAPAAAFTYTDQSQGEVDFMDQSSNQPTSWDWDFGDTNSSTMQNPSHTFATSGMYEVCLTATNAFGSNTICQTLNIEVVDAPVAAFSYTDQGQGAYDFMDQSTNQPTSWEWDFGDTNSSTMQNPSHTFATSGMYDVCLTVSNIGGSNTSCQTIDVIITSTKVITGDLKVELFPNPAADWLGLKLESNTFQTLDFVLFNEIGQPVLNRQIESSGQFNFDIKSLSTGLYYFSLRNKQGQVQANGSLLKK